MGIRNPNSTNYQHSDEPNLYDLHKAMDYNAAGQPVLRVSPGKAGSGTATAFGEPYSIPIVPVIQLDAIYGSDTLQFQTYTGSGGTVTYPTSKFVTQTSSTAGSYTVIRSRKFLRYRPGQGILFRGAVMYGTPAADTGQRFGMFNAEEGYGFGYDGTQFGILHSYGGKCHIHQLALASYTGAQTFTITLNSVAFTVSVTAGQTVAEALAQVARGTFTGWLAEQSDGVVYFLAEQPGPRNGTYSFASSGTASGTMTQDQAGVAATLDWTYQSSWNIDKCDGTGESTVDIDWQKFNIIQIQMQWLGVGATTFSIQNPNTGQMMPVHRQHWVNENTTLHVDNPNFKVTQSAFSSGSTTPITLTTGSWMGAVEGTFESIYYPRSRGVIKKTLAQDVVHHLFSIKNPLIEANKINTRDIRLLDVSASVDSTDPVIFYVFLDSALATGNFVFQPLPRALADYSDATGTFNLTAETPIIGFTVGIDSQVNFELDKFNIKIPPGMIASVAAVSESAIQKISATFTWAKD